MPRLSIIVPHLANEAALEQTLVSLLEHRSSQVEVIVAHSGDYADPYCLSGDEITLLELDPQSTAVDLINEAASAATSRVVQILMPGTVVADGWYEDVLPAFNDRKVAAVAAATNVTGTQNPVIGIRASQLPRRQLVSSIETNEQAFPLINGGYFSRKLLLSLGGLFTEGSLASAEVELALALQATGVMVARYAEAKLSTGQVLPDSKDVGYGDGQMLGRIARAYANLPESPIKLDSLPVRMGRLAASLFNPVSVAHRLGWTFGLQDGSLSRTIANRIAAAQDSWNTYLEMAGERSENLRRAA